MNQTDLLAEVELERGLAELQARRDAAARRPGAVVYELVISTGASVFIATMHMLALTPVLWFAWNACVPSTFHVPPLTLWQAAMLLLAVRTLRAR